MTENPFLRRTTPKIGGSAGSLFDPKASQQTLEARLAELTAERDQMIRRSQFLDDLQQRLLTDSSIFAPRRLPRIWRRALRALNADGDAGVSLAAKGAHADLFWVSRDMGVLAGNAAEALPEVHLGKDLWPSDVGFMVFSNPMRVSGFQHTKYSERTTESIRAVLWAPDGDGLTIAMYADVVSAVSMAMKAARKTDVSEDEVVREVAHFSQEFGDLMPIARGHYPVNKPVSTTSNEGNEPHLAILVSTMWLLMQQPLVVETTKQEVDAKTKRKLHRSGDKVPDVRLIDLRRARGENKPGNGNRNYEHQWMVRGHWRKQWMPSLNMHRPTWVRPHIKGPEGKPFITGEKVNVWRR